MKNKNIEEVGGVVIYFYYVLYYIQNLIVKLLL